MYNIYYHRVDILSWICNKTHICVIPCCILLLPYRELWQAARPTGRVLAMPPEMVQVKRNMDMHKMFRLDIPACVSVITVMLDPGAGPTFRLAPASMPSLTTPAIQTGSCS